MGLYGIKQKSFAVDFNYTYVKDNLEAFKSLEHLMKHSVYAVDTETTGLDPYTSDILLLQIGTPDGNVYVYDMRYVNPEAIRPALENKGALYLLHNAKFDYKFIKLKCGIELSNIYDTMLAERMLFLGLNKGSSLKDLLERYLKISVDKEIRTEFLGFDPTADEFSKDQLEYAAHDVACLFKVLKLQNKRMVGKELKDACRLEFDLVKHVGDMELRGVLIDDSLWGDVIVETKEKCSSILNQIIPLLAPAVKQTGLFGSPAININSQQQLLDALRGLGLQLDNTSSGMLKLFKNHHEVVSLLLEYRGYEKLISSFGDNILALINPVTGRIHADFNQLVSTGRMSCLNPNLQQIPGDSNFRRCFIAKEGYKLVTADMSQAELRILASYAKEEVFKKAIREGKDLHAANASFVFDVPYEEVLRDKKLPDHDPNKQNYRSKVKALIFGIIYGMSKYGLGRRLNITDDEAQNLIDLFFKKFPNAKRFLDEAARQPILDGYSKTVSGRKRFYKKLDSYYDETELRIAKSSMRRQGMNTPIQGCIAAGMHVAGAGFIENNVNNILQLPVGTKGNLLSKGKYSGIKDVYKVTTRLGFELIGTYDHRIMVGPVWIPLGETMNKSILMSAVPYKGKPTQISKTLTRLGFKGSKYMTDGYAFMFGFGIANHLTNHNCYHITNVSNNIEKVFIKGYKNAFGNKVFIRSVSRNDELSLCIGKKEASLIDLMIKNKHKFYEVILKSPLSVRFSFIAGYILNNMYSVAYDLQYGLYIKCINSSESKLLQQVLLSVGVVASSSRSDIITGTVGCMISSEFVGNLAKGISFIDMEYGSPTEVKDFKDKVVSVDFLGKRRVYDFIGKYKPHTFLCQGVYVHNSNADVIKKATCILGERLKNYDAGLVLQVHDEIVVEVRDDQAEEVAGVVSKSIVDGWDYYFKDVPMEADANIKPYWEK